MSGVARNASSVPRPIADPIAVGNAATLADASTKASAPTSVKAKYCPLCREIADAMVGCNAFETKYSGMTITASDTSDSNMLRR